MTSLLVVLSLINVQQDKLITAVRAAMAAALPFPSTDDSGSLPVGNNSDAMWMVIPQQPGDETIEVVANPLNQINQMRAARAMAQIEASVEAAQRRASAQYDRAVAEAQRTGKSQPVDGVTLADEGIAGAKIDADSHVTISLAINQPGYSYEVASALESLSTTVSAQDSIIIGIPASTYRDEQAGAERYAEAQTFVFLGKMPEPQVRKLSNHRFEVVASTNNPSLVVRLRGNEQLIGDLLSKTNWNALLELLK
jgi:hypothetical protein